MRPPALVLALVLTASNGAQAQDACQIQKRSVFQPQRKTVVLAMRPGGGSSAQFVLFQSKLRVNTDGAPNSYHPDDLKGAQKAINNIANGVSIRDRAGRTLGYAETLRVFGQFRDNDWRAPDGYRITWGNVIAARQVQKRTIPCIFQSGDYKGYFGSLTRLQNGLPANQVGECEVANQLDERFVPALVMADGQNPLRDFGVKVGDLVVALNPGNRVVKAAVVGDTGPEDNLGEGSVALNMALLQRQQQPKTYDEAKTLDTGSQEIVVAIVPGSKQYKLQRPYGAQNIEARVSAWLADQGYGSTEDFAKTMRACAGHL